MKIVVKSHMGFERVFNDLDFARMQISLRREFVKSSDMKDENTAKNLENALFVISAITSGKIKITKGA